MLLTLKQLVLKSLIKAKTHSLAMSVAGMTFVILILAEEENLFALNSTRFLVASIITFCIGTVLYLSGHLFSADFLRGICAATLFLWLDKYFGATALFFLESAHERRIAYAIAGVIFVVIGTVSTFIREAGANLS